MHDSTSYMSWWHHQYAVIRAWLTPSRLALLLIVGVITLIMSPALVGGAMWLPLNIVAHLPPWSYSFERVPLGNTLPSDLVLKHYPQRLFYARELWQGSIPLWNPYVLSGTPFMAVANSSVWYPLTLLFAVLPTYYAFGVVVWLHLLIGGVSSWYLARRLDIAPLPALLVPLTYLGSGFTAKWVELPTMGGVIAWAPVAMYGAICLALSLIKDDLQSARRAVVVFGMGIVLAGLSQPDTSVYVVLASSLVFLGIVASMRATYFLRALGWMSCAGVVIFGLMAPQMLPTLELGLTVSRAGGTGAYSPLAAVTSIAPELLTNLHTAGDWGYKDGSIADWYVGMVPFGLWILGLWLLPQRPLRVLAVVAIVCWGYAISPVSWWQSVPVMSQFRELSRAMLPASLLIGVVAAGVLQQLWQSDRAWTLVSGWWVGAAHTVAVVGIWWYAWWVTPGLPWRILASYQVDDQVWIIANAVAVVLLLWRQWSTKTWLIVGLLLVVAGQQWWYWRPLQQPSWSDSMVATSDLRAEVPADYPSDPVLPTTRMQAFLQRQPGVFRIFAADYPFYQSNTNVVAGFADVRGFDSLIWGEYAQFVRRWEGNVTDGGNSVSMYLTKAAQTPQWLNLTNVEYVLFKPNSPLREQFPGLELVHQSDEGSIYRNPQVIPRANLVHVVEVIADKNALYERLRDPAFAMATTVLAQQELPSVGVPTTPEDVPTVVEYLPNRVVIAGVAQSAGVVVISDTNYPGWHATYNGEPTTIYTVNGVFRGIWVPAGPYQVTMWYWPQSLTYGLILWGMTVVILGTGVLVLRRRTTPKHS